MTMSRICGVAAALTLTFSLAACGTSSGDRLASGALLGAAGGALIGGAAGNAGLGAVAGAVAGGAIGAASDPCSFNLGDPVWKDRRASREDYRRECGRDSR